MQIQNCTTKDIPEIFRLYGIASAYQRSKQTVVVWPEFEQQLVETEVAENRQWGMHLGKKNQQPIKYEGNRKHSLTKIRAAG